MLIFEINYVLIKRIFILLILLNICSYVFSQLIQTSSLYSENPYSFNPAYAGEHVSANFYLNYQKVTSNLDGVPESMNLGGSAQVFKNMSLGGRFYRQTEGLFRTIVGFADYSYLLKLSKNNYLRFGISAGINSNSLNYSKIIADDPSGISEVAQNHFEKVYFESSAGIVFQSNDFEFSFAVPKLFSSKNKIILPTISFMQYSFSLQEPNIELKPSVLIDYKGNNPILYSLNLQAHWKRNFWLGVGYKNRPSLVLSTGVIIKNIGISYASELNVGKYSNMFNQIHEISFTYAIQKKKIATKKQEINPFDNLVLKENKVEIATEKIKPIPVELVPIDNDTANSGDDLSKPGFEIVDAGGGVYVLKPINNDENIGNYDSIMLEKIMEPELDYLFAPEVESEENEPENDIKMKHAGGGIFVVQPNSQDTSYINKMIEHDILDSLITKSEKFESAFDIKHESNKEKSPHNEEYYTIRMYINGSEEDLLNNSEVADMIRIEFEENGTKKYFYGYFPNRESALRQEKKLKKYNIKTKVLKF